MNKVMIIASVCISLLCYSLLLTVYGPHGLKAYELELAHMERLGQTQQEAEQELSRLEDQLTKISEDSGYRKGLGSYYGYSNQEDLTIFLPEESGYTGESDEREREVRSPGEYESPLSTVAMLGLSLLTGLLTLLLSFLLRILKKRKPAKT